MGDSAKVALLAGCIALRIDDPSRHAHEHGADKVGASNYAVVMHACPGEVVG
jgi:hypothetical protein